MGKGLIDKISLALSILLVLTIGFIAIQWTKNGFQTHKSWVYSVDVNDNGTIASASENEILLWQDRYCIDSLIGHTEAIKSISFSHNNKFIASGSIDKTVRVWSIPDKTNQVLDGHIKGVNKVEFSQSDNYIISSGYDDKLFIWDWRNKKELKEFNIKHTGFSISKTDVLAFTDTTCNLQLFDLNSLSLVKTVGK